LASFIFFPENFSSSSLQSIGLFPFVVAQSLRSWHPTKIDMVTTRRAPPLQVFSPREVEG